MDSQIIVLTFEEEPFDAVEAFNRPTKAEDFLETVNSWQDQNLVEIGDDVNALRGKGGDVQKKMESKSSKFTLGGGGVGLLAGLLLGVPVFGLLADASVSVISARMKNFGIDDNFIKETSQGLGPNTSALFLLGMSPEREKLLEEMKPFKTFIATTNLPKESEQALRDALKREG